MKVVINKCYGGFSLSPLAIKRLAELNGKPCYFFKSEYINGKSYFIPASPDFIKKRDSLFFTAFTIENPNEYLKGGKDFSEMTRAEREEHNKRYTDVYLDSSPSDRADPKLIQVVEELGNKADGACAELTIVEIPNDIEWDIDEYDGIEHIAEKHRTWS